MQYLSVMQQRNKISILKTIFHVQMGNNQKRNCGPLCLVYETTFELSMVSARLGAAVQVMI